MRFETRTIGVFEVLSVQLVADEVFDAGRLRQETLRLVERGSRRIVVDLGGVDYLYSDSINALVALNRRMLESSGRMGILVPHPKVYDILVRAGLENIMRLYRSEAELQSDSRELMRQSSAWTRPAELLSAASASQVLSANVLSPKNPNELRDAASASQRIPRRRVGSRVELKPRRRGGRGMDQEQPTAEFQLPPALPALPGESTTMRTLSQDSSAFDQQSTFSKTSKAPRQPIQPRPEPPPSVEPSVYNVPENTQHDGYSTDAWLLSLTSPATAKPTSPEQIVEATAAAGSSSFLPKVSPNDASKLQDTPSKFATEFAWDESEISLTGSSPGPSGATPPTPTPPAAPPVSPWLSQPTLPPQPPAALAPPAAPTQRSPARQSPPAAPSPFLDSPHSSAFLDDSAPGSTVVTPSNPGLPSSSRPTAPASADPWRSTPATRPAAQPDLQSAIFHDHPESSSAPRQAAKPPSPPQPVQPPAPQAVAPTPKPAQPSPAQAPTSAAESWFSGTPVKPSASSTSHKPPQPASAPPPPQVSAAAKSGANSLNAWFGAGAGNPTPTPAKSPSRAPTPQASSSASSLDWVTPTHKSVPENPKPKTIEPPKPQPAAAPDNWITPASSTVRSAPANPPAPAQPTGLDSWISSPPTTPIARPTAPESVAPNPPPAPTSQPSAMDSWLTPAAASHSPRQTPPTKDAAIGGTSWLETSKPHRKPVVTAPKEPTSFLDLDDLDGQPSSKKPLMIALVVLALVAMIGLGVFFLGGTKRQGADVPPGTTPVESTEAPPLESPPAPEVVAPAANQEKEPAPEPEAKSKPTKSDSKTDPKPKSKSSEKQSTSTKETGKAVVAPVSPPPPPEEIHAPVKIFVTSRPSGATVTLDGTRMGVTPCEITFKRVGNLEFSLAGYRKQSKGIDPEETRGTVNVQLSADGGNSGTGRLYISSAPVGAEIVVGGKSMGKTPKLVELPVGSQKVTVRSGVLSKTRTIDIQSGTNTAENFSL